MPKFSYTNVLSNYTKDYEGIEVGPKGVEFDKANPILEKYVPTHLERTVTLDPKKSFLDNVVKK